LEIGSASAERAGQGEVGGCNHGADSMAISGFSFKTPWLDLGEPLLGDG